MPQIVRPYAAIVVLLLILVALPAVAGEGTRPPKEQGLLVSLWQAVMDLVSGLAQLGPGLDPLGGDDPEPAPRGDLGPGLDPAG